MNETGPFDDASASLAIVLTVRFLLELALLAGVAIIAWQLVSGWWRWPAAILAVAAVAIVWGVFLSPQAAIPLAPPAALMLETVLFLGTAAGLLMLGSVVPAAIGSVIWVVHRVAFASLRS